MKIFIVGVGRSGTKFLRNVLERHPQIHISSETHFFSTAFHNGFIKTADKIGNLKKDKNVKALVDKIFEKKIFGSFWRGGNLNDKERLLDKFISSDRSFKSLFHIILEEDRAKHQKAIGGEKTPSHLYHVDTILKWFPEAKVLHILRDPRDVLSSDIHKDVKPDYPVSKKNIFYNIGIFLAVIYNWSNAVKLDKRYKTSYPSNYKLVKYEDLLHNHRNCVGEICTFLGVDFSENMLNPPVKDSSFTTSHRKAAKNINYKFKKTFEKIMNKVIGEKMKQYEYVK